LQKVLLLTVLSLATISPLVQAVGASFFFDPQVTLHWKADPALRNFLSKTPTEDQAQVNVLIVFSDVPSSRQLQQLSALGTLETFTGHVADMHLPTSMIPQIASLDFVSRISYPKRLSTQLDVSVPEIGADKVWQTMQDANGNSVNGTGVIIGIIDTGIDYHHGDFFLPNGTNKILSIWDQSVEGNHPQGFDYGNECTRLEIQISTCEETDGGNNGFDPGHGTAVAAVAASTGQSATLFESCLRYDGIQWHNETQQCQESDDPFVPLADTSNYAYFGANHKFSQIFFNVQSPGEYGGLKWEYSEGNQTWLPLAVESNRTIVFTRSGPIFFTPPRVWATQTIDDSRLYWVRVRADSVDKPALISRVQANPPYTGVAPGASLVVVKVKDGNDDSFLAGTQYVVNKARELGMPLVIDYSFGDHLGSHDGTEPLELALTDLASQGVPIAISAGNHRDVNFHVSGKLSPGQAVTVPWWDAQGRDQFVDLWYSVNDALEISVTTPKGAAVTGPTPDSGVNTADGNVVILSAKRASGKEWWINITSRNPLRWSFRLTAVTVTDGKWDAWTEPGEFASNLNATMAGLYKFDPSDTIDYPGTARGVITVGDYMAKYFWRSGCDTCIQYTTDLGIERGRVIQGIWWTTIASAAGNITIYSAMGPTRDGRTKPEIVAPGANIAAARASNAPEKHSDPDNYHQVGSGTSLSAPHAVGVIALMLQMNHFLSPNEIRTVLTEDARQDQFTGRIDSETGSPLWGWGKVDALNSTRDAVKLYSVRIEIDSVGAPFTVSLARDGQTVATSTLNQTRIIILEFQRGGNHTISLSSIIPVEPGTRYALPQTSWTFSSGGEKSFHYNLQYFLNVTSAYGYATGTGWYDANSTAVVSVIPSETEGHQFQGWTGSVTSNSQALEVRMDSSKQMTATWTSTQAISNVANVAGFVFAIILSIAIALIVRHKTSKRS
jgi:hypothetical protein